MIGVIVPVYKVEKYIIECIESILTQTYTNFRLILVDDGTPDSAGKICDEYAQKDPRITVIHQENAGVPAQEREVLKRRAIVNLLRLWIVMTQLQKTHWNKCIFT